MKEILTRYFFLGAAFLTTFFAFWLFFTALTGFFVTACDFASASLLMLSIQASIFNSAVVSIGFS